MTLDIKILEQLSKLKLSEEEEKTLSVHVSEILLYVAKLQSADIGDITMMTRSVLTSETLREDEIKNPDEKIRALIFLDAPSIKDEQIETPQVF